MSKRCTRTSSRASRGFSTTRARSDADDDDDDASAVDDEVTSVAAPTATAAARRIAMPGVTLTRTFTLSCTYNRFFAEAADADATGRRSRDG